MWSRNPNGSTIEVVKHWGFPQVMEIELRLIPKLGGGLKSFYFYHYFGEILNLSNLTNI